MLRSVGLIVFCSVLIALLGCSLWRGNGNRIGVTRDDYRNTCGSCHRAHRPGLKSDEEWRVFMREHRFLCGMDEETADLYADYLAANN